MSKEGEYKRMAKDFFNALFEGRPSLDKTGLYNFRGKNVNKTVFAYVVKEGEDCNRLGVLLNYSGIKNSILSDYHTLDEFVEKIKPEQDFLEKILFIYGKPELGFLSKRPDLKEKLIKSTYNEKAKEIAIRYTGRELTGEELLLFSDFIPGPIKYIGIAELDKKGDIKNFKPEL